MTQIVLNYMILDITAQAIIKEICDGVPVYITVQGQDPKSFYSKADAVTCIKNELPVGVYQLNELYIKIDLSMEVTDK